MPRRLMNILLTILLGLVALCLWLMWNEPRLIYYPSRRLEATPRQAGLPYEDVWLTATDGVKIHGWFVPGPASARTSADKPPPTLLFFHGNAGNISHRLEKLALFHQLGAQTLIIDYRGYGQSEGRPGEQGTYRDAEAAYAWLRDTGHPSRTAPLFLYGESLGAAIAVELATRHAVAGVILEEPFASVAAVGRTLFPFLPLRLLVRNRYDTLSKIDRLNAPLLIFHSPTDEVIPYRQGQALFEHAREPKTFVNLRGSHNEAFLTSGDVYRQALTRFLGARQAEP